MPHDRAMLRPGPHVQGFFDPATSTVTYLVHDPASRHCAIIDPVLDYESGAGRISSRGLSLLVDEVRRQGLTLDWILETHAHADHLSGAHRLQQTLGGRTVIGEHISAVQEHFANTLNLRSDFPCDGRQFDRLVADREQLELGQLSIDVIHTPGHTPACVSYLIGDAVFVGDTLFMPDYGTARADFPGGDAHQLFRSIQRLLALPRTTRMFVGHDYPPGGRSPSWETTVAAQRESNRHAHEGIDEATFVQWRRQRDAQLAAPALLWPSLQVNIRAGQLPGIEDNGVRYLKIPLSGET